MNDPEHTKLLTEIRDLLASRERKYAEFIDAADQRNAAAYNRWLRSHRGLILIQWAGLFIAVYAAVYFATLHAR